jgi:hypothetical protein
MSIFLGNIGANFMNGFWAAVKPAVMLSLPSIISSYPAFATPYGLTAWANN